MPRPSLIRCNCEPSAFITYCWSQVRPSRADWKINRVPSPDQYASAFSPPLVITEAEIDEMLAKAELALADTLAWVRSWKT